LRVLRESFISHRLAAVSGILNGTSNFILTEMERDGRTYEEALLDAQRLGYAEADPTADVGGGDAACKLAIITRLAFGQKVALADIRTDGIDRLGPWDFVYGRKLGRTPRQLAEVLKTPGDGLYLSVRTHMVPTDSFYASVAGPFNAVLVQSKDAGDFFFAGPGAGGVATATAVYSDVLELARGGPRLDTPFFGAYTAEPLRRATSKDFVAPFYLRFLVRDRPGILADIARCLADHHINIDAVMQSSAPNKGSVPFVITLEPVVESQVEDAVRQMDAMDFNVEPPLCCPMTP
jgi:homoserine dehydrogenase